MNSQFCHLSFNAASSNKITSRIFVYKKLRKLLIQWT